MRFFHSIKIRHEVKQATKGTNDAAIKFNGNSSHKKANPLLKNSLLKNV